MNIVALIEGNDPQLKSEIIGLGAHLDHLGVMDDGTVFPGADDNASGVAALLEVAEALQHRGAPLARSVLFMFFTGEENGLLGSTYYQQKPIFPHEQMVAMINLDSVSRDHGDDPANAQVVFQSGAECWSHISAAVQSASQAIALTVEPIGQAQGLEPFDVGCNAIKAGEGASSDQLSFTQAGVPAIIVTVGEGLDYHSPGDTVDKVNVDKLAEIAKLTYRMTEALANPTPSQ